MKIYIGFLSLILVSLFSCNKEKVITYDSLNYVKFTKNFEDTTNFSFFFYNNIPEVSFPIEVTYIGKLLTKDMHFKVVIDEENSTINSKFVELPEVYTLKPLFEIVPPDENLDEEVMAELVPQKIYVKFKNDKYFDNNQDTLTLKIVDTDDLLSVGDEYGRAVFIVTAKTAKPLWWDDSITDYYLGEYSESKYRHFMTATDKFDLTDLPVGLIREYSIEFKRYLEANEAAGNTIYEESVDGKPKEKMTVNVNG